MSLHPSQNIHDWLGEGVYFWINAHDRALDWARNTKRVPQPAVLCAVIDPMNCLNLLDLDRTPELAASFRDLSAIMQAAGVALPANGSFAHGVAMRRNLDCAVMNHVHAVRRQVGWSSYDTVLGAFDEGPPAYPGAAIRTQSHVQIAVRNLRSIVSLFVA